MRAFRSILSPKLLNLICDDLAKLSKLLIEPFFDDGGVVELGADLGESGTETLNRGGIDAGKSANHVCGLVILYQSAR